MRPRLRMVVLVAAATLATPATPTAEGTGGDAGGGATRADLRTVTGRIATVDAPGRKVTIETADGTVVLEFDRNTNVYLDGRLGTVRDLAAGAPVRASFGAERLAYWIEVQPRGDEVPGG